MPKRRDDATEGSDDPMNAPSTLGTKKPNFWMVARRAIEAEQAIGMIGKRKFKSDRAAKIAYTKAEKAAKAADERVAARVRVARSEGYDTEACSEIRRLEFDAEQAWGEARAIYKAAIAQRFYVHSSKFGYNVTRDLIRANMD